MARFQKTLENLERMAKIIPAAMVATSAPTEAPSGDPLVKQLVAILRREDYDAVRLSLLVDKLITKYKGRAV